MKYKLLPLLIAMMLLTPFLAFPWVITYASGGWEARLDTIHLDGFAGSDFSSSLESPENVAVIELYTSEDWRLDVSRTTAGWPSGVSLSIRISDKNVVNGNVVAPPVYSVVTETPIQIASGRQRRSFYTYAQLGMQFELDNLSVQIDADTYITTVTYTVTEQ